MNYSQTMDLRLVEESSIDQAMAEDELNKDYEKYLDFIDEDKVDFVDEAWYDYLDMVEEMKKSRGEEGYDED